MPKMQMKGLMGSFSLIVLWVLFIAIAQVESQDSQREAFVIQAITDWNALLTESDRQAKYTRLLASSFSFYRGTNHLFWHDLIYDSRLQQFGGVQQTRIWVQGDLHTENYGSFGNSDGVVEYNINDFDESVLADYQLDLWRLATSLVLVMQQNNFGLQDQINILRDDFAGFYLEELEDLADGKETTNHRVFSKANTYGKLDDFLKDVEDKNSRKKMLDKWAGIPIGKTTRQFNFSLAELEPADDDFRRMIYEADGMRRYGQSLLGQVNWDPSFFAVKDVARRTMAGTGSLGAYRYYVLIEGPSSGQNDDIILDMKYQPTPTARRFMNETDATEYDNLFAFNSAFRHNVAYLALTEDTDNFLGYLITPKGYALSVRERSPFKDTFPTATLDTINKFKNLAQQWATILAVDHSRSDEDFSKLYVPFSFEHQVTERTKGLRSEFKDIVQQVALGYADQVNRDYSSFVQAQAQTQARSPPAGGNVVENYVGMIPFPK